MKQIKVICSKCDNQMTYKNWFSWVWHTPFHWFGKRRDKCANCGEYSYMKKADCEFCHYPFKHCAKFYIKTKYPNDPNLYVLRKEDSVGGTTIEYCPWCGRKL